MSRYAVSDFDVPTGAVKDTFKTMLALKAANTAGHRGRLRSLAIGGGGGDPQDIQFSVRVAKTDNAGDGTGDNALTIQPLDPEDIASVMTAKSDYSVEPTNVGNPVLEFGMNGRGSVIKEWPPNEGPLWGKNETLVFQMTPGEATAGTFSLSLEWDE